MLLTLLTVGVLLRSAHIIASPLINGGQINIAPNISFSKRDSTGEQIFEDDKYTLSVTLNSNTYLPVLRTSWKGTINYVKQDTELLSYTICQFGSVNEDLYAGVIKAPGETYARVVVAMSETRQPWSIQEYTNTEFTCKDLTCRSNDFVQDATEVDFLFVSTGKQVHVFYSRADRSDNIIATWISIYDLGDLLPWGYMFAVGDVYSCADLPQVSISMEPSEQSTIGGSSITNTFARVISSINHNCAITIDVTSSLATLNIQNEQSSGSELPTVVVDQKIALAPVGVCLPSEWDNLPRDCGSKYCDSNVWFANTLRYNGPKPTRYTWTNLYYPFMMTEETTRFTQHYYAYYTPVGYTGFQPIDGGNIQIIFSTFTGDTVLHDTEHCKYGADGGAGISCKRQFPNIGPSEVFYIRIRREGKTTFVGEFIHDGNIFQVGKYEFNNPDDVDAPENKVIGFIENFTGTNKLNSCCDCAKLNAVIFGVFSTDAGGAFGTNMEVSQYGSTCTEEALHLGHEDYEFTTILPADNISGQLTASHIWKGWVESESRAWNSSFLSHLPSHITVAY